MYMDNIKFKYMGEREMKRVLSFDIGGTSIKYGVVDFDGNVIWKDAMDTEAYLGGEHLVSKVKAKVEEVIKSENIEGVAISTAGIVHNKKGEILAASNAIPGYKGQKIKEEIEKTFGLFTTVENDVNCAAAGEIWRGAARDNKNIFCATLGTGVGGCVIADGKVVGGKNFCAGEVAYLTVNGDILNNTGSTSGLIRRVCDRKGLEYNEINGKDVFDMAFANDEICIEEIDTMIDSIAQLISIVSYVVNPEAFIIGGGVVKQKAYLLPRIIEKAKEKVIPYLRDELDIRIAELENDAGMVGAVYNFKQQYVEAKETITV